MSLPAVSFPARQQVASPVELRIAVRNDGARTLPDVAVSIDSFAARDPQPGLQSPHRPIWILDRTPGAGAGGDVWALGPLAPGATTVFLWRVTPVRPGSYTVGYRVAAGLARGAVAELNGGGPPSGVFAVTVTGAPADARVDPLSGRVIRRARPSLNAAGAGG